MNQSIREEALRPNLGEIWVDTGTNYLNVCAHCGECLKQLVLHPNKLNVVVFYKNEKGDFVEWNPSDLHSTLKNKFQDEREASVETVALEARIGGMPPLQAWGDGYIEAIDKAQQIIDGGITVKRDMINLKSSANTKGPLVTQIITATTGVKKTIEGIRTDTIRQGQFTKFETQDGRLVMVNDANVLTVEVFKQQ